MLHDVINFPFVHVGLAEEEYQRLGMGMVRLGVGVLRHPASSALPHRKLEGDLVEP